MRFAVVLAIVTSAVACSSGSNFVYSDAGANDGANGNGEAKGGNAANVSGTDGGARPDGADTTPNSGGVVGVKNLSFTGNPVTGSFTFIVTNESDKAIETVNEIRVHFAQGSLVFTTKCEKLVSPDPLALGPGESSKVITMPVSAFDTSSAKVRISCGGGPLQCPKMSGPMIPSTDAPTSITLNGLYDDASVWSATADVQ